MNQGQWHTIEELHQGLSQAGVLTNLGEFQQNFLLELKQHLERIPSTEEGLEQAEVIYSFNGTDQEISWLVSLLWTYLTARDDKHYFKSVLGEWWTTKHEEADSPQSEKKRVAVFKKFRQELEAKLPEDIWLLRDRTTGKLNHKKIHDFADHLDTLFEILTSALEYQPDLVSEQSYDTALATALNTKLPDIQKQLTSLDEELKKTPELSFPPTDQSELVEEVQKIYRQSLKEGEELTSEILESIEQAVTEALATEVANEKPLFEERHKQWIESVRQPDSPHEQVRRIEVSHDIAPTINTSTSTDLKGLLHQSVVSGAAQQEIPLLEVEDPDKTSHSFLYQFYYRIRNIFSTFNAEQDTEDFFKNRYDPAIVELLAYIKNEREELLKQAKDTIKSNVLGAVLPTSDIPDTSGGTDEEPDLSPDSVTPEQAVAAWVTAAQTWSTLTLGLTPEQRQKLASWLAGFTLDETQLQDIASTVQGWMENPPVQSPQDVFQRAQVFQADLTAMVKQVQTDTTQPTSEEATVPTVHPSPQPVPAPTAGPLDEQARKAALIKSVSVAKATLLNGLNGALEQELQELSKNGLVFTSAEIEALIAQQQGQLSQDIWYKLLEAGALQAEQPSTVALQTIWSQLLDEYLQRIVVQHPQLEKILQQSPDYSQNQTNPRFFREWLKAQQFTQFQQEWGQELANGLRPELVAAALAGASELATTPLDDTLRQYILNQISIQAKELGFPPPATADTQQFLTQVFNQLHTIRTSSDASAIQASYQQLYELFQIQQLSDTHHPWTNIFFQDPLLYALFFALPELQEAQQYINEFQQRWEELAQQANTPLSPKQQQIATYFAGRSSAPTADTQSTQPTADYAAHRRMVDLEFGLNLVFLSELEDAQKRTVETAIYTHFVLNQGQDIPLENVMVMIYQAGLILDEEGNVVDNLDPEFAPAFAPRPVGDQIHNREQIQQERHADQSSKLQLAIGAAKVAGYAATGQWQLAAKEILQNRALREKLEQGVNLVKKAAPYVGGVALGFGIYKLLEPFINWFNFVKDLWNVIKAPWQAAYDLGSWIRKTIVGDESKEALQTQIKGATNELTAAGSNTIQSLGTTASETLTQASYATGQSGVSKSLLTVLAASTLGPLLLAALLTIIVITVIGGSLNDLPFGYELPGSYLGKLGMLNTTDMACLAIDQSTFGTTEGVAMIKPLQEAAIQVMRHQGMRNLCNAVGEPIVLFYNPPGTGLPGAGYNYAYGRSHPLYPNEIRIGISPAWADYSIAQPFTIAHELGHIAQHNLNYAGYMSQAVGDGMRISTYPLDNSTRESQAEAMGLTFWVDYAQEKGYRSCPYSECSFDIRSYTYQGKNVYQVVQQYLHSLGGNL